MPPTHDRRLSLARPSPTDATANIVLAAEHPGVGAGLRLLLESTPGVRLVGATHSMETLAAMLAPEPPDAAVIVPSRAGPESLLALGRLHAASPGTGLLLATVDDDERFAHRAFEAGARGVLLVDRAPEELAQAILTVVAGAVYPRTLARGRPLRDAATRPALASLSRSRGI